MGSAPPLVGGRLLIVFLDDGRLLVSTSVLLLLSAIVGVYILCVVGAAVTFFRAQHLADAPDGVESPFVSVVVPVRSSDAPLGNLLDTLRASDYPANRYEVLVVSPDETVRPLLDRSTSSNGDHEPSLHLVETGSRTPPDAKSEYIADQASGDVLVTLPPEASLSPNWLPTVAAHAPPRAIRLAPPVTYAHNDRFLPRLQALEQIGQTAARVGIQNARHSPSKRAPAGLSRAAEAAPASVASTAAPEAQVHRPPPAATLGQYVETTAERFLDAFRHSGPIQKFAAALYWLTHTSLLVAGAMAVALPAWRQPVLLAFLAKMGGDLILAVPAARHFGQRGLLRSIVPTELFLVLAVPAGGLLGAWTRLRDYIWSD